MASFGSISIVSLILFLSCALLIKPRNVKADDAEIGQFPYNVGIFKDEGSFKVPICGGVIIDEYHILTSGMCGKTILEENDKFFAILGTPHYDGEQIQKEIDRVGFCPGFSDDTLENDLAMLRTMTEISFSETIKPIALPTVDLDSDDGVLAVVSSWEYSSVSFSLFPDNRKLIVGLFQDRDEYFDFSVLNEVQYQTTITLGRDRCIKAFGSSEMDTILPIDEILGDPSKICAKCLKSESIGLTGAPLVANETLIGVTSFTFNGEIGLPNVFTKVYLHMDWIRETILGDDIDAAFLI